MKLRKFEQKDILIAMDTKYLKYHDGTEFRKQKYFHLDNTKDYFHKTNICIQDGYNSTNTERQRIVCYDYSFLDNRNEIIKFINSKYELSLSDKAAYLIKIDKVQISVNNGKISCQADYPAFIGEEYEAFIIDGKFHRKETFGPAFFRYASRIADYDPTCYYYVEDKIHRVNGSAILFGGPDKETEYNKKIHKYLHGKKVS